MGINFVLTHMPIVDKRLALRFQEALQDVGVEYDAVEFPKKNQLRVIRKEEKAPFEIRLNLNEPSTGPVAIGQLLVLDSFPMRDSIDSFIAEAENAIRAFESVSSSPHRQVLSKDVALRDLYSTGEVHAFQLIWEEALGQSPERIERLGRPIHGGGLRFVMPPRPEDHEPVMIELKIESFLEDTSKLFIEAQLTWPMPTKPGSSISPTEPLRFAEDYITNTALRILEQDHD